MKEALVIAMSLLSMSMAEVISIIEGSTFMCDNSVFLYQSDDGGDTWTTVVYGVPDKWNGGSASLSVVGTTILRIGCWNWGGPGYLFGAGLTVDGVNYPIVPGGAYEFVGWETLCEGVTDWNVCHPDIPFTGDISAVADAQSVSDEGPLVSYSYAGNTGIWPNGRVYNTGANRHREYGIMWVDFDFSRTCRGAGLGLSSSVVAKHSCVCKSECADTDEFCNTMDFVREKVGQSTGGDYCPYAYECCCSCPNCPGYAALE